MRKTFTRFLRGSVCLYCSVLLFWQAGAQTLTPRYTATCANNPGFYEWLPAGYQAQGKQTWPLLIFLNGSGDFGNGDSSQLVYVLKNGPGRLMNEGQWPDSFNVNKRTFRFIVFLPEFKGVPTLGDLDTVVNYAVSHYNIDPGRVYMTGLSSGGNAVWYYASASLDRAKRLAAIIPISAGYFWAGKSGAQIFQESNLAIFAAANRYDSTIVDTNTIEAVNLINGYVPAIHPKALDTIYDASGHDAWTETYDPNINLHNGLNCYQWMLQYSHDPQDSASVPPPDTTKPAPPDTTKPSPTPPPPPPPPPVTPPDTTAPPPATPPATPPSTPPPSLPPPSAPPIPPPSAPSVPPPPPPPPPVVQLSSFDAVLLSWQPKVGLSWTTASEAGNRYFVIQRSADSKTYINIDTVDAAPDAVKGHSYSTIDETPFVGDNYYRLAQVGADEDSSYPEIRKVIVPPAYPDNFSISPNPAGGTLHLYLTDAATGVVQLRVLDVLGRTLSVRVYQKQDQVWMQTIDTGNLETGSYFIQVIDKNSQVIRAFIKR